MNFDDYEKSSFNPWPRRRVIQTELPEELTEALERSWRDRRKVVSQQQVAPEMVETTHDKGFLDHLELRIGEEVFRTCAKEDLIPITSTGPVWTYLPWSTFRDGNESPEKERPWKRGTPLPSCYILVCRVTSEAIPRATR